LPDDLTTLTNQLVQYGIRPSIHRIKILDYLHQTETHPAVDEIFTALSPQIPSLSKATVYNTLHTLIEAGLVREVNIDLDAQRYDIMLENHGHFQCVGCGEIFNFDADIDQIEVFGLQHFQIDKKDIYFTGLCPACKQQPIVK
jgi:Fe2+ or Zn2+ uptake regulation protein